MGGCSIKKLSVIQLPIETQNPAFGQYFSKRRLLARELGQIKASHINLFVVTYRIRVIIWKLNS